MIPNVPWRKSIVPFADEAIASIVIRLAPEGLTSVKNFMRNHLDLKEWSVGSVGSLPLAIAELAIVGSFDKADLLRRAWTHHGDKTIFMGRTLPVGWFDPQRRRVAPSMLAHDGADPWLRNGWLIRGLPCDPTTGETILDRCPKCKVLLGWTNLEKVWQCETCEFDIRLARPTYQPAGVLNMVRELAGFFNGNELPLREPFSSLTDIDILKFMGWFAHFCGLPEQMLLRPSPANAVDGYRALKEWPRTFDGVVSDLTAGLDQVSGSQDILVRTQLMMRFTSTIDRLASDAGRKLVHGRLAELFEVPHGHIHCYKKFFEPVLNFAGLKKRYEWPAPSIIEEMRSSHDRARLMPRSSRT